MIALLRRLRHLLGGLLLFAVVTSIAWSFAASNMVDASHAGDMLVAAAPPQVTPTPLPTFTPTPTPSPIPLVCASLDLTNYIVINGSGAIHGTDGNDLITGSPGKDTIHAGAGNDCIVGNGGADQIFGDEGFDLCIGGGDFQEQFHDCEIEIP